jgi:putative copper export protein
MVVVSKVSAGSISALAILLIREFMFDPKWHWLILALPLYDFLLSTNDSGHKAMNEGQTRPFKPG